MNHIYEYNDKNDFIKSKEREILIAKIKALDEQLITHPQDMYAFFRDIGWPQCKEDGGQFCGGIFSESYKKDGRIYTFLFEGDEIIDATSVNDI